MRNLKKVLSLVLCMAMMLSIMVVGAGAAFKDQSKIVNEEAVDMCAALNIINGYTDGSFKPEGNITRAEACKMICVALNGGKEPVLGTNATPTFSDVRGTSAKWAEGYIEYCVAEGIVAGIGGGKFNPNGNVTGSQFAKMLLIALGYRADHEKFLGNAWEVNVNVKATQKGLYEDLETMDVSAALTRDNAAQMVWNALQANEVAYEYTLATENGQLVSKVTVEDKQVNGKTITLLKDKYSAVMTNDQYKTVTLTGYKWNDDNDEFDYTLTTSEVKDNKNVEIKFSSAVDYTDLFAMQVNVVYKDNKDKDVYGIYAEDSVVLYEGVVSDLEAYDNDYVKVDGTKYKVDLKTGENAGLGVIEAYAENQYAAGTFANSTAVVASYTMKVIDLDGNGKIDCIVYLPFDAAKVTYVGKKDITLSANTVTPKATFEDDVIYDGVAKDDYVAIVDSNYTAYDGDVITKLDSVAGTLSAVKTDKVMIDGNWYKTGTIKDTSDVKKNGFTLNDEYTLYVVGEYVYFAEEGENNQTLEDLVYVKATSAGDTVDAGKAKVYFADGTSATVTLTDSYFLANGTEISVDASTTATNDAARDYSALNGKLCTFEKDGNDYELTLVGTGNDLGYTYASDTADAPYGISAKVDNKAGKIGGVSVADDAVVFIVETDGDVNVVPGTTAKAYKAPITGLVGGVMLTDKVNGVNNVMVALVNANMAKLPNATGETELYAYVLDNPYYVKDGDDYYAVYTIWNGKDEVVVREEMASKNSTSDAAEGRIIQYTDLGNKEIDDVILVTAGTNEFAGKVAVKGTTGNEVYMTSGSALTATESGKQASACWYITDDTVILYVDSEDMAGFADGTIQNAREEAVKGGYKLVENAYLYGNTSNHEITLLVVETSNQWH